MLTHMAQRLAASVFVVLAASFVTYFMFNAAPGDVALTMVGESASEEQLEAVRRSTGLTSPS